MIHRCIRTILAFLCCGAAAAALAQQPAASASTAAPAVAVPKHTCGKPAEYPGNLASDKQKLAWQKDYVGYVDCLKKFVSEQQALAEPHVKALNSAIDEYNAGVKQYNAQIEKSKGN